MERSKWEVLKDLKSHHLDCVDLCGACDEINTLPAKRLYEKALHNFDGAKEEIEEFYKEMAAYL